MWSIFFNKLCCDVILSDLYIIMKKKRETSHAYGDGHGGGGRENGTGANVTSSHVTCLSISRNHTFNKLNVWPAWKQCPEFN